MPNLVNQPLWTIGPELLCYACLAILITTGIVCHNLLTIVAGCASILLDVVRDQIGNDRHAAGTPLLAAMSRPERNS